MINLLKDQIGTSLCAICHEDVDFEKSLIVLEIKTVPPYLFFFHLDHFKGFFECLETYAKERESAILEEFLKLNIDGLRQEKLIAKKLGIKDEFKKDLSEIINLKIYEKLRAVIKKKFTCPVFEDMRDFEDCLECIDSYFHKICSKKFIFSIKPETNVYKKIMSEI